MSCQYNRDQKIRNLVCKQGKWESLKKLKVHACPHGIGGEGRGSSVMELSFDENIDQY